MSSIALMIQQGQGKGIYMMIGTSTLQMNVSDNEEKIKMSIVLRAQLQT